MKYRWLGSFRRLKLAVGVAALLALIAIPASADTGLQIASTSGTWSNPIFESHQTDYPYFALATDANTGERQALWGRPITSLGNKSGLGFIGINTTPVTTGSTFQIGTLTHYNNPVLNGSIQSVDLQLGLTFAEPATTWTSTFTFEIDETPNQPPCAYPSTPSDQCSDKISLPTSFGSETIAYEGRKYILEIVGFQNLSGETVTELISQENRTTTVYLMAQIVDVTPSVSITAPADDAVFPVNTDVSLSASITDPDEDGTNTYSCVIDWGDTETSAGTVDIDAQTCSGTHTYGTAGEYKVSVSIDDGEGGSASDSITILVDVPPVIAPVVVGDLGNNEWYTGDIALSWEITSASNIVSQNGCDDTTINTDTAGETFTCTATNGGGTATQSVTIKRDATPPTIVPSLSPDPDPDTGWYNGSTDAPEVSFACDDALSGVIACPDAYIFGEGASQSYSATVYDQAGNSAFAEVTGVNVDLEAPVLELPQDQILNATSPDGADFSFNATASDNIDTAPSVTCDPSSGTFPFGSTTVECSAVDAAGNEITGSFEIYVNGPAEMLAALKAALSDMDIHHGIKTSLMAKLNAAESSLNRDNLTPACNQLQAFIAEADAQRGKHLTDEQADFLVSQANQIRLVLGCQ